MNANTVPPLFARLSGNPLSDAFAYQAEGLAPIPVKRKSKEPAVLEVADGIPLPPEKYREYWAGETPCGVAIALGARSKGLIDLDLDWPEARALADELHFMYGNLLAFGRTSTPRAHRVFYCSEALEVEKCKTVAFAVPSAIAKKLNLTKGSTPPTYSNCAAMAATRCFLPLCIRPARTWSGMAT